MNTQEEHVHMNQAERIKRYGIECIGPAGDGILYKAGQWRPGGEYVQKLIIRNVSTKTKKIKYQLPSTRYFSLAYPEPIILSPGMFKEIDVIFRPVEYEPYDDTLYIKMLDGIDGNGFYIPVRATIDKLILVTPVGLDLGYCATHQISTITFQLVNAGEVDAPYEWDVPPPFTFTPASGTIAVGQHHDIVVTIRPEDASVFVAQAMCHVGKGVHAIIPEPLLTTRLSAIAKYAFIALSESLVSFDEVVSGTRPDKQEVILQNNSVVPAEFDLVRFDADRDEVFEISPRSGVILPQSEITITVQYNALAMGCYSLDRYVFRTPGNCSTKLVCRGTCMPPKVLLFKEAAVTHGNAVLDESTAVTTLTNGLKFSEGSPEFSLNFRDVEVGRVETRILFLQNDSPRDVPFSVIADENGVFQMHPKQGVVPSKSSSFSIKVIFSPLKPANFYRRFFVLVGDALPLFYDCLGTGFIRSKGEVKEQRPFPLRHAHIQAYRNRSVQGLGGLSPDELDAMYLEEGSAPQLFAHTGRTGTRAMSVAALQRPVTRTGESVRTNVAPAHEFFIDSVDASSREVTLSKTVLDFGYAPHSKTSSPQAVTVHNHTHAKVVVQWHIPIVNGVDARGRGAAVGERHIISEDTAGLELALLQAFVVSPITAEINPGKSTVFEITFAPKQSNRNFVCELEAFVFFKNQRTFRLVNDHSMTPPWCLTLSGVGHTFASGQLLAKARVMGGNIRNGKLVFPCCFEGESIYQTFTLRNTSNLPSTFKIELGWGAEGEGTSTDKDAFSVKPDVGEVDAENFVLICVRFSPKSSRKYIQLLRCIINGESGGKLMLEGAGATPFLVLPDLLGDFVSQEEQVLGLGARPPPYIPKGPQGVFYLKPTCVGLTTSRKLTLKNGSRLPLRFRLTLDPAAEGVVSVSCRSGVLKGNEDMQLTVSFAPQHSVVHEFKLGIQVFPIGGRTQRVLDANQPGPVAQPELLQSLSLVIVAPGEVGALVFDPPRLNVDVRLVNTSETKDIFLDNVSDADLRYQLLYKEEFLPDSVDRTPVRSETDTMALVQSHSFGAEHQVGAYEHCLFCESPNGIIPARSRVRVVFTFQPRKSGLFEFLVVAQVQTVDKATGEPVMVSNDEAVLLRTGQQGKQVSFDMASTVNAATPLMAAISARAAFPKLLFEDIRTDSEIQISDLDYLWQRFSFAQLNYDLSVPMTAEEVQLNHSATPDLTVLPKYSFEFSPAVVNSPLQKVVVRLRNNGYLTTAFHMHLPNESTLELEQWCDEDEPSEELNRLVCIIEELKLFTIEPRHCVLLPGEVCTLSISYSHTSLKYLGLHNLPVLVKLDQGKQFFLNLLGHTLPAPNVSPANARRSAGVMSTNQSVVTAATPSAALALAAATAASNLSPILLLICTGVDKVIRLAPVPTGLSAALAPRHRVELLNVSGVAVHYEVDEGPLSRFNEEHFHLQLVRIANPVGVVPAGGSVFLEWYFYPLESRTYEFAMDIKYYSAAPAPYFPPLSANSTTSPPKSSSRKNSSSSLRLKDRSQVYSAQTPAPITYQYLSYTVQATGYDPRDSRPIKLESLYEGGVPPSRPLLMLPAQSVTLSQDMVNFEIVPQHCTARRVVILRNHSDVAVFEFVVDESTCILCVDGLLSVSPTFGKIEPNGSVVLDLAFRANTQPLMFEESIKLMVRELIKGVSNRRGGVKHLLDRIKSKKTTSTEHESVVSRPTFARTMQIESLQLGLQEDRKATYPVTVNAAGNVVSFSRSVNSIPQRADSPDRQAGNDFSVTGGLSDYGAGNSYNRVLETDVPAGSDRMKSAGFSQANSPNNRSYSAGSKATPLVNESVRGSRLNSGSEMSSRGGLTPFTRDSNRGGSRAESAPNTLLGTPLILSIRLRGEVHSLETTRCIMERLDTATNSRKSIMEEYVVPQIIPFVAPVGKRLTDPDIVAAGNKARVNIAFVKGRDRELREAAVSVMDSLVRDLLRSAFTQDLVRNTLSGANPQSLKSSSQDVSRTQTTYGVFFNEIRGERPLESKLVVELQHLGVCSCHLPSVTAAPETSARLSELERMPSEWRRSGDEVLLVDLEVFAVTVDVLRGAVETLGIRQSTAPALYKLIENTMMAVARHRDASSSQSPRTPRAVDHVDETQMAVRVAQFARSLPREAAAELNSRLTALREQRIALLNAARKMPTATINSVDESTEHHADTTDNVLPTSSEEAFSQTPPLNQLAVSSDATSSALDESVFPLTIPKAVSSTIPARDPPIHTSTAMRQEGFLDIACDLLGSAMLGLLREVLSDELADKVVSSSDADQVY